MTGVLLYLIYWHVPSRHHATTTYLNHFTEVPGVLLAPFNWPQLIYLNFRYNPRRHANR